MVLCASYVLGISYNKAVKIVSIKNPNIFYILQNLWVVQDQFRENLQNDSQWSFFFEPDNFLYFDYEDFYNEDGQEEGGQKDDEQVKDGQGEDGQGEYGQGEDGQGEVGQGENGQVVGVQQEYKEMNLETYSTCSTTSAAPSLHGRGGANVQNYVQKANCINHPLGQLKKIVLNSLGKNLLILYLRTHE